MHGTPRRLRERAGQRPPLGRAGRAENGADIEFFRDNGRRLPRRLRAIRRALLVIAWTLLSILVQAPLVLLPGRPKIWFARLYWSTFCRLLGMQVRVIGAPASARDGGIGRVARPVVFVSNHSSWLDVPVLGGRLEACFIAKEEVATWPLIRTIARLGRTVMVSRNRSSTGREREALRERLHAGDSLVLFPEGTTSDGSRVLPFRTAFFAIAEGAAPPLIQPVSVVYDRLAGLPTGRASRPLFAWYGDMDIASHFWRLAQHRGLRATVLLHTALDPRAFADRKALAGAVWATVADGAATLRQNRPARPLAAGGPVGADDAPADGNEPAFA